MIKDFKMVWKLWWVRSILLIHLLYIFNYFTGAIFLRCLIVKFPSESVGIDKIILPLLWLIATVALLSNEFKAKLLDNKRVLVSLAIMASMAGIVVNVLIISGYISWWLYLIQVVSDTSNAIFLWPLYGYIDRKYITNITVDGDTMNAFGQVEEVWTTSIALVGGVVAWIMIKHIPDMDQLLAFNAWFDIGANVLWVTAWWLSLRVHLKVANL